MTCRSLATAALLVLCLSAWGQFAVEITDTGSVNVSLAGVRCLDSFQVILPAPGWRGGAGPAECTRDTPAPGHTRITGIMTDGEPCADFTLDARLEPAAVNLEWELRFIRDLDVETVRLNGYLPCELAAGKAAWFIRRQDTLKWGLMPERLGTGGGDFGDWGFDWFGWLLPGEAGVRFRPLDGLTDMYFQDGRQWGASHFQTCWTLVGKGTVRAGTVLRCAIRLEALAGADLAQDAERLGLTLLSVDAALGPSQEGVAGQVTVRNVKPDAQSVHVNWRIDDDLGSQLAAGTQAVDVPPLGAVQLPVAAPNTVSGDYRLHVEAGVPGTDRVEAAHTRLVLPPGPRLVMSLDGDWRFCTAKPEQTAPPAEADWKSLHIPGRLPAEPDYRHWCCRSFELPNGWAGKRLKLCFQAVNHEAKVFVNGQLAGQHLGGNLPFEIDITDLAQPGPNHLAVLVTNWTAACTNPPETFELKPYEHPGWKIPPSTIIAPIGGDFRLTGIWQRVFLEARDPVHIQDVFVQTSVRRRQISATVTVRNDGDTPHTVDLTNTVSDRAGTVLTLPSTTITLAPGERREVTLQTPWQSPHLWSLDDPYLYRLQTTLSVGGHITDVLQTRFGFREVWCDGPRFVLNGIPMKLFAVSGWSMPTWEDARARLMRTKRAGVRCMRLHTQPWEKHILDVADELGLLIVDEAGVYCYAPSYAPHDPRFWDNYAAHLRDLALRDRNHPSLIMYSLENEIISCGGDPKVWEPQLGNLADRLRQLDPTRLITCESDLDPAGKMDIIGMHYPHEYWQGYTLYPDKCWWMDGEIQYLGRKWRWRRNKPLYIGEFDGGFMAWYPQYQAFWIGDEAYTWRGRFSAASPNSRARRELIQMEVAAYRHYGVTGLNPWFDTDEVDLFGPLAYAPLALSVREQTRRFRSGEEITRTASLCNDSFEAVRLRLRWRAVLAGQELQAAEAPIALQPCTSLAKRMAFRAPQVDEPTPMELQFSLERDGTPAATYTQVVTVFPPRPSRAQQAPRLRELPGVYLFDPRRTAARSLALIGLRTTSLRDLGALPQDAGVILIAPNALPAASAPWAAKLAHFVATGGAVVCFAQRAYPPDWLPVPVEIDPAHSTTVAFPRAAGHPILEGLKADDLRFWRPDHLVCSRTLLKPTRGSFIPIIDAGGIRGAIHDLNGLNWTPLLELPHGRGRYLLCQLPVVERAGVEPAAETLLERIVQYALRPPGPPPASVGLMADPDSSLRRTLDALGVDYDSLETALDEARLAACRVILVAPSETVWETLRSHVHPLRDWMQAGGVLWLNRLTPDESDLLRALANAPLDLRPAEVTPTFLAAPDPLTMGMSNHELYWRERPIWDQNTPLRRIMDFQLGPLPPAAKALTDPPGLVKVPVGEGCLLINQLLLDSTDLNRLDAQRILSILLTNLGVRVDLSPFARRDEAAFICVDLAPYANLGFAGDPDKGWMDHGPKAMADFPLGRQTFAGVPFFVINPAENGGKSVIALRGAARPQYPTEVLDIRIGTAARALYFLHTCAWGQPQGAEAAAYVVRYADGSAQRIPLRIGLEIADWYADPAPLPYAQVAWRARARDKQGDIGLHVMRWVNPYPERPITALDFVSAQAAPVPVLIAVTVER